MTILQKTLAVLGGIGMTLVPAIAGAQGYGIDLDLGASATTSTYATSSASAPSDGTDADTSGNTSTSAGVAADLDLVISLDRDDSLTSTARISSPTMVATGADLETYAKTRMKDDEHIKDVELASDEVSVTYEERAHLFGFYPMTVDATATVDANGDISVDYPWYGFLLSTNEDELAADLESRIEGALSGGVVVDGGEARMTATAQARVLTVLHDTMKSSFTAATETNASASTR